MVRNSFVFYKEWMDATKDLPDSVRLEIYDSIIEYATTGDLPDLKPMAKIAFNFIKNDLDRDFEKYTNTINRNRENGKNGGRPKGSEKPKKPTGFSDNPSEPQKPDNDNEDDNVNDNPPFIPPRGYENFNFSFLDKKFEGCLLRWLEYKKTKNQKYKSVESLTIFYNRMVKGSGGVPQVAMQMIEQSMANNWDGLFELKGKSNEISGNTKSKKEYGKW